MEKVRMQEKEKQKVELQRTPAKRIILEQWPLLPKRKIHDEMNTTEVLNASSGAGKGNGKGGMKRIRWF